MIAYWSEGASPLPPAPTGSQGQCAAGGAPWPTFTAYGQTQWGFGGDVALAADPCSYAWDDSNSAAAWVLWHQQWAAWASEAAPGSMDMYTTSAGSAEAFSLSVTPSISSSIHSTSPWGEPGVPVWETWGDAPAWPLWPNCSPDRLGQLPAAQAGVMPVGPTGSLGEGPPQGQDAHNEKPLDDVAYNPYAASALDRVGEPLPEEQRPLPKGTSPSPQRSDATRHDQKEGEATAQDIARAVQNFLSGNCDDDSSDSEVCSNEAGPAAQQLLLHSGDVLRPANGVRTPGWFKAAKGRTEAPDGSTSKEDVTEVLQDLMQQFPDGLSLSLMKQHVRVRCGRNLSLNEAACGCSKLT